ncbi:MAG: hypothetical protein EPN34_07050 [Burkholderiaceae bacterium]|nr:MAG: hypothetical protein EPN34_07050 [Burkholderiaceae bacterium]
MADLTTRSLGSAGTAKLYLQHGAPTKGTYPLDVLAMEVIQAGREVNRGDLSRPEQMLVAQAVALDAIFNELAQRAIGSGHMKHLNTYLKLALRAQAQARANVEALGLLKNPQPYIRQANIANQQQVNNGVPPARTAQIKSEQSELLGASNERLDIGAPQAAIRGDSALETVGALNRPED